VFPRIGLPVLSSVDLSLKLLYEAKVITVPGSGFGPTGEGHLRLSFGAAEEELEKAFDRIEEWGIQYK
jgi:aminotransferase